MARGLSRASRRTVRTRCRWRCRRSRPASYRGDFDGSSAISTACARGQFRRGDEVRARRLPRGAPLPAAVLRRRAGDAAAVRADLRRGGAPASTASRCRGRAARRPGRMRIGYLSADLRNHVMGKMVVAGGRSITTARASSSIFYSLSARARRLDRSVSRTRRPLRRGRGRSTSATRRSGSPPTISTSWSTCRRTPRRAARHPGAASRRACRSRTSRAPAPSACRTIDFKLTDRFADLPENQAYQIETLLPMDGCVYPYRHVAPARRASVPPRGAGHRRRTRWSSARSSVR